MAREHFERLAARAGSSLTAGLGGMGSAQPLAVAAMLGGVVLCAEVDGAKLRDRAQRRRRRPGDRRPRGGARMGPRREGRAPRRCRWGCTRTRSTLLEALLDGGRAPDVVTDLTAAHDLRYGYVPDGAERGRGRPRCAATTPSGWRRWRGRRWPATSGRCSTCASAARWCSTTATTCARRPPRPAARGARVSTSSPTRYLRPLFCRGIGPFRWMCASGARRGPATRSTTLCAETFPDVPRVTDWIALARRHVPLQGLPARIVLARARRARALRARRQRRGARRPAARSGRVHARPHGRRAR